MEGITRKEFAEAVAAGIASVQHLYREVDRMIASLRDALLEEPEPLVVVRGGRGKGGNAKESGRVVLRNEYSLLFGPVVDEEEIDVDDKGDEEDENDEPEETEEPSPRGKRTAPVEIDPDQPFLAVRIVLIQSKASEDFEPVLQYAALSDWGLGPSGVKPKDGEAFTVKRYMFRRIPRILGAKVDLTKRIVTAARAIGKGRGGKGSADRRLSCRVPGGVQKVPLYDLDDASSLDGLAARIKDHWAQVVGDRAAAE